MTSKTRTFSKRSKDRLTTSSCPTPSVRWRIARRRLRACIASATVKPGWSSPTIRICGNRCSRSERDWECECRRSSKTSFPRSTYRDLLALSDFEVVKREWRQLLPRRWFGLGPLINRYIGTVPLIRGFSLRHYLVARSLVQKRPAVRSATVVIPCRNERGNIEAAVTRMPRFCDDIEILFVEGHSHDGTLEEIHRVIAACQDRDIKVLVQDGKGKADAVFKAFAHARGDVLIVLDADLTMPPEQLPKFWNALALGRGEFINGSRLVYPMEKEAMRFLNLIANRFFSILFTWLLNQRFTDTLCGTKVLKRTDYERLRRGHGYFGDFDPFGDFELIFGAAKLNLKVVEVPVRYANRVYGETQISRFRHGLLLLRMVVFAYRKFKAL